MGAAHKAMLHNFLDAAMVHLQRNCGHDDRSRTVCEVECLAINDRVSKDAIVWTPEALGILAGLVLASLAVIAVTTWVHARKPAFY